MAEEEQDQFAPAIRRWLSLRPRDLAMTTRIAATIVVVSVLGLLVTTVVGIRTGRSINRELDREQLVSLQASAASDVSGQLLFLLNSTAGLARSPEAATALESFTAGHSELLATDAPSQAVKNLLADEYRQRYLEPLRPRLPEIQLRDVLPANRAGVYLQSWYSLAVEDPLEVETIDDAGDGSQWTEVHTTLHPGYRDIVDRLDVLDLYLIEAGGDNVVYSVAKRPDLGTSLRTGPFSGSGLAAAVDRARDVADGEAVITDLSSYAPALTTPVGFVASPVRTGGELVGFVVLMYDGAPLDRLMTADRDWDGGGYPPTGETVLFGSDGLVRTEPRSFVEDPDAHLDAAVEHGLTEAKRSQIEALDSTVLIQSLPATTVSAAVGGNTAMAERPNILGVPALSVVAPVSVGDLDWFVASEIQVAAANERVQDFASLLVVGVAIIVVALAFGAVDWARSLVRPIRDLSNQLGRERTGRVHVELPPRSPVEFADLTENFESMTEGIDEQRQMVADTRRERLELLRRMLPPTVAARIESGEQQTVDEVSQASVAVLVLSGLSELMTVEAPEDTRELLNTILAELDDLAARHQLDRIKVVGDAYFASCGHDRPLIDHAPRTLAYAADAADAIGDLNQRSRSPLALTTGIHSGPVMVGMTGGFGVLYDVWGETVSTAHHLARSGRPGQILVSTTTKTLLPDGVETTRHGLDSTDEIWLVTIESVRSTT